MALPTTGPISLGQVRAELAKSGPISLGSADVRALAGISGTISLEDLRGKSSGAWTLSMTVASLGSNTYGYNSAGGSIIPKHIEGHEIYSLGQTGDMLVVFIIATAAWANANLTTVNLDGTVCSRIGDYRDWGGGFAYTNYSIPSGFLQARVGRTIPVSFS